METSNQRLGLIVLNYNNSSETVRFLSLVSRIEAIDVIQVVDNASTDESYKELRLACDDLEFDGVFLSEASENKGYGSGNNYGYCELSRRAGVEYVIIANPDVQFDECVVLEMADFLNRHDEYAAVAPIMLSPSKTVCQSAWRFPTVADLFINALRLAIPMVGDPLDYGEFDDGWKSVNVDVLPGSLFMIRSSDFERVGGFDEDTFLYGEENLLFAKLAAAGRKCSLLLDISYIHAHGTSITKEIASVKKRYLMQLESNLVYCDKVLGLSNLTKACYAGFFRCCLALFSAMYSIRSIVARQFGS